MKDTSEIVSYAVWCGMVANKAIESGLRSMWANTLRQWDVVSLTDGRPTQFEPYIRIGTGFYLVHAESHWSPGDVSGFLKSGQIIGCDQVIAILMDKQSYLPWHGLRDRNARGILERWKSQANEFTCRRRKQS
jgi:hypothetical protein